MRRACGRKLLLPGGWKAHELDIGATDVITTYVSN